jgi:glucose-6-phosphate 1-epimerase
MSHLESLKSRFAAHPGVSFVTAADLGWTNDGSRGCVVVENDFGRIVVALNGAHLMSWVPTGKADVLWMSPQSQTIDGRPIRGGIPLCAPWFGPGAEGTPLHGWARITDWTIETISRSAEGATTLALMLTAGAEGGPGYAVDCDLRLSLTLGATLTLAFSAVNRAAVARPFEFAFHTYFAVGDVAGVSISGFEGCRFVDRQTPGEGVQDGPLTIAPPVNKLFLDPPAVQVLTSPAATIRVTAPSRAAVVWNPGTGDAGVPDLGAGAHHGFVCLERCDAAARAVTLAPGESYATKMELAVL